MRLYCGKDDKGRYDVIVVLNNESPSNVLMPNIVLAVTIYQNAYLRNPYQSTGSPLVCLVFLFCNLETQVKNAL